MGKMGKPGHTLDRRTDAGIDPGIAVLFLAASPLILWLFQGSLLSMITALLQLALFAVALRLIARGTEIARAFDAAKVARRPRFPRKMVGSALMGLVVLILAGHQFATLTMPLACGLVAFALSLLAFGPDPLRDKGMDDPEALRRLRNAALMTEIETALAEATARINGLGDTDLTRRTDAARVMVVRLMHALSQNDDQFETMRPLLTKFTRILSAEVLRLEAEWEGENYLFARRRYIAKLEVLAESVETVARRAGVRAGRDGFDMEADLLLERMRRDTAA